MDSIKIKSDQYVRTIKSSALIPILARDKKLNNMEDQANILGDKIVELYREKRIQYQLINNMKIDMTKSKKRMIGQQEVNLSLL